MTDDGASEEFVASLAVGLAAATWEDSTAAAELVAAAGARPDVIAAARRRVQQRRGGTLRTTARAVELLESARTRAVSLDA